MERTQPFGDTSFLQIYYDGFTSPYQVLDYECFVGCENNRIVEVGRTFSLDTTLKGKYANYLVLELTPDFNNNDEFSIAFIPVKTLADVKGTFYSEAYDEAIALNAPKDISLGTSYATIAENGGKADVWANFATADYVIDVNGNIPVWSVIGSPGNTIGISYMTADEPTFDSNGWKKAKLYGRTTMADGSVDPGRNFETSDSNQFLSADGYVNPVKRDTNEMWYVYTELLINRDARAGDIVDLTFTVSGD